MYVGRKQYIQGLVLLWSAGNVCIYTHHLTVSSLKLCETGFISAAQCHRRNRPELNTLPWVVTQPMSPKPNLNLGPWLQIPHQFYRPSSHDAGTLRWVCRDRADFIGSEQKGAAEKAGHRDANFLPGPCPWRAVYPRFVSSTTLLSYLTNDRLTIAQPFSPDFRVWDNGQAHEMQLQTLSEDAHMKILTQTHLTNNFRAFMDPNKTRGCGWLISKVNLCSEIL